MRTLDFGVHSDDYASFRPGFPASFYERLDVLVPIRETYALDLATGPGTIALELAERGSLVEAIDISPNLIATARRLATERGLERRARFSVGRAEESGFTDDSFDLVTAGQCWHWFDSTTAFSEARRVLRPDGYLVIAYFSYLVSESPVAADTESLILNLNPTWTMAGSDGIFPKWKDDAVDVGLGLVSEFCYEQAMTFTHTGWRGRMRTCNGVGSGGMAPDVVQYFDQALADLLQLKYPEPLNIPHRVWCIVLRHVD